MEFGLPDGEICDDGVPMNDLKTAVERMYDESHAGPEVARVVTDYSKRHSIYSASILTIWDDDKADVVACYLADRVRGKVVVEIGAGLGLLALHLSDIASKVIAIEANPMWTSCWVAFLHKAKPKNVTWIFGAADEVAGMIRGDVAVICTCSDHDGMAETARLFAPEVIDVYRECLGGKTGIEAYVDGFNRFKVKESQCSL